MDSPSDQVHPGQGGGEGETSHNRVERLSLEFAGDGDKCISGGVERHFILYILFFILVSNLLQTIIFLYFSC